MSNQKKERLYLPFNIFCKKILSMAKYYQKLSLLFNFTFVPWAFKKSKGLGFPSTFYAKKSFQWQNITRSCPNCLFLILCHEHSKKVKALASLQRFLQKNPFKGKILPGAVLIIYSYFCAMSIQKE